MAKNLKIEYLYSGLLRVSQCSSISDIFYRGQLIPELEIGDFIFYNVDVFTRTINESRTIVEYGDCLEVPD